MKDKKSDMSLLYKSLKETHSPLQAVLVLAVVDQTLHEVWSSNQAKNFSLSEEDFKVMNAMENVLTDIEVHYKSNFSDEYDVVRLKKILNEKYLHIEGQIMEL